VRPPSRERRRGRGSLEDSARVSQSFFKQPLARRVIAAVSLLLSLLLLPVGPASADVKGGDTARGPATEGVSAPAASGYRWSDVPSSYWDKGAIDFVAKSHTWMQDYGTSTFRPTGLESRAKFAKAIVQALAPTAIPNPRLRLKDMDPNDPRYNYARVAVTKGWMGAGNGYFLPTKPVNTRVVHRALLRALGLGSLIADVNVFHTADGYRFKHPDYFGVMLLGMALDLRYNHGNEAMDVGPLTLLPRAEVAYSLWRAYRIFTVDKWELTGVRATYTNFHLNTIPTSLRPVFEFGLRWVGYPYVYAGEWYRPTPPGYCCGYQPVGGFDCSGLMWWVLKSPLSYWSNLSIRHYRGYVLNERVSNDMAHAILRKNRVSYANLRAGNLMFYGNWNAAHSDAHIFHVDLYLGNGWALNSGSPGVSIVSVRSTWYRQNFVWGRRLSLA